MCDATICTFSGKFGDILFSLATVKAISERERKKVDFCCMPAYRPLLELIRKQDYICHAWAEDEWKCLGSPYGDQPWEPPRAVETGRKTWWHLTYRRHPMMDGLTLADAIAWNGGVELKGQPWISVPRARWKKHQPIIAYGFNEHEQDKKIEWIYRLKREFTRLSFVCLDRTHGMGWTDAAEVLQESEFFIGDLSALHVLAHAVGRKCLIYEPSLERRVLNYRTYQYRFGVEVVPDPQNWEMFTKTIREWREEKMNEPVVTGTGRGVRPVVHLVTEDQGR